MVVVGKDGDAIVTRIRMSDGYINATELCRYVQKPFRNYLLRKSTLEWWNGISECLHIPVCQLSHKDGAGDVWVEYHVGTDLAQWCSARSLLTVYILWEEYIKMNARNGRPW